MRPTQRSSLVSGALLCLLVIAESLAVAHALDFEAHAPDEVCKICIGAAALGGAAPARAPTMLLPRAAASAPVFEPRPAALARAEAPSARGPPPAS